MVFCPFNELNRLKNKRDKIMECCFIIDMARELKDLIYRIKKVFSTPVTS